MRNRVVTFDPELKQFILSSFGKSVDKDGYVVEKDGQRVLTPDGEEVKEKDFAGLHGGSLIFVRSGIVSIMQLSDRMG